MLCRACFGLIAALALGPTSAAAAPWAEVVGTFVWRDGSRDFGGLSALELSPDGLRFLVVSDRAGIFSGAFVRDTRGAVASATIEDARKLVDGSGIPLAGKAVDSEGLALLADGTIAISFEGLHRLTFRADPAAPESTAPPPPATGEWRRNQALEALAAAPDGTLWTLTEGRIGDSHAVLRFRDGAWLSSLSLSADGAWRPVGADFGPDGRLYLLERDFWPLVGFMSRVLRFDVSESGLSNPQVLLESRAGVFDNLEALAVWQDGDGAIRLTLVSDDNFLPVQWTEVVDLRVTE